MNISSNIITEENQQENVKLLFSQKNVILQIRPRIQSKTRVIANLLEYEKP